MAAGVIAKAPGNIRIVEVLKANYAWTRAYEETLNALKDSEKFMPHPYSCAAGKRTVGYGHVIKPSDHFTYPMDEEFAEKLLKTDFDYAMQYVQKTTKLQGNQLLAISHFVFCLGSGNFEKSTLKQKILTGEPIDDEIMRWTHIKTNRGIINSSFLKKLRKMELNLFKS
jgi:lysozyme